MKKILTIVICVAVAVCGFCFTGCNDAPSENNKEVSVRIVVPDGAPALSIAKLIKDNQKFGSKTIYKVVAAENIKNFVVGSGEKADIALVPVNLASLMLGSGSEYKAVASVTHGNLYMLSKDETAITEENFAENIKGKSVAIVNIANVPGLTFKATLEKFGVEYTEDEQQKSAENVFLTGISGTDIAPKLNTSAVDYVIAAEPAVSTITGKVAVIKKICGLHEIYGEYPQAIMVVKAAFLQENKEIVKDIYDAMAANEQWIIDNPADAAEAVANCLTEGYTSLFTAENTTSASVSGCNIKMKKMTGSEISVIKAYIEDILKVNENSAKTPDDNFFFDLDK